MRKARKDVLGRDVTITLSWDFLARYGVEGARNYFHQKRFSVFKTEDDPARAVTHFYGWQGTLEKCDPAHLVDSLK